MFHIYLGWYLIILVGVFCGTLFIYFVSCDLSRKKIGLLTFKPFAIAFGIFSILLLILLFGIFLIC